jgi:hypothetical protein
MALGILCVCYVSWLHQDWSGATALPQSWSSQLEQKRLTGTS